MRALLKILVGGLALFLASAIVQEWSFFASRWFEAEPPAPEHSPEERRRALEALRQTLELTRHFYASGGDPRFADRMPTAEGLIEEMRADIEYLARNHRRQEPVLEGLAVLDVETVDGRTLSVRTRERWSHRLGWIDGSGASDPPRSQTVEGRYLIARGGRGWRVEGWELLLDDGPPAEGDER